MKIRLRLGDADRERYGCPEWMELDPNTVSMGETIAMQKGIKVEDDIVAFDEPTDWLAAIGGRVVRDADGEPVMENVLDDDGRPILGDDGKPERTEKRVADWGAWLFAAWMALRRAGHKVPLRDVDPALPQIRIDFVYDEEPTDAEGKGESVPETTSA